MAQVETFGRYRVVRKLGRSMTDVYLADDLEFGRPIVLKLIEHSRDEFTQLAIEAEKRGAVIQKQLHQIDRRILEVFDSGEQDGCFFVVMEYFPGRTLAEILHAERRLDPRRAVRYAVEICSQLRTLHSFEAEINGRKSAVVHGDIKPSNVQIGAGEELKLLDFGIAKAITSTHNLTRHNLGSPSYCSPERLSKAQVDPSADLWALGVSLYEMVAGSPPYQAQDTRRLENLIQSRRPPRALPETCPADLRAIVAKALAGDLQRRYQTAQSFEADLRAFLDSKRPLAALEHTSHWDANATVDKQQASQTKQAPSRVPSAYPKPQRSNATNLAISLLTGILVGLIFFIPFRYTYRVWAESAPLRMHKDYAHEPEHVLATDWALRDDLKRQHPLISQLPPVAGFEIPLRANLTSAADNVIDNFRNSSDSRLSDFDWQRARLCLVHALEVNSSDPVSQGKLALCDGYLNLIRNPKLPKASFSIDNFRQAESYLPRSPDPHLALARVYVYAFHNIGEAAAEFHEAEQVGYRLGPREAQEEGDGYLFRAQAALAHARRIQPNDKAGLKRWLQLATTDLERAQAEYDPIEGFSDVDAGLKAVYAARAEEARLETVASQPIANKPNYKHRVGSHRWR
ncbi:MAG: serine/threonine protein kinase [Acidobacteriaceae bacterium]|nr:serine/threonine protein kinase [Acidobacteriaceae bacterium]